MKRIEALERLKELFIKFENILQADGTAEEKEMMGLVDEHFELTHINDCVNASQAVQVWINEEIEKEEEKETALLPDEGIRTGALVGE